MSYKKVSYDKGMPVDMSKKCDYVQARVQTSRLNEGGDLNWKGSRKGSAKGSTKMKGKPY